MNMEKPSPRTIDYATHRNLCCPRLTNQALAIKVTAKFKDAECVLVAKIGPADSR